MLKRNITYFIAQGGYWMCSCCALSFASVLLLDKGYTNTQIGIILAMANLISVFFQQIIAKLADRSKKIPLSMILMCGYLFIAVCSTLLTFVDKKNAGFTVLFVAMAVIVSSMQGLINALCYRLEDGDIKINFGIGRGVGSLTFSIISIFIGNLAKEKVVVILLATLITALLNVIVYIFVSLNFDTGSAVKGKNKPDNNGSSSFPEFFKRYKLFFLMLFGVLCAWISQSVINIYFYQVLEYMGGDSGDLGGVLSFAAVLEIIPMFLYSTIEKKIGVGKLIVASTFFFFLKAIVIACSVNVYMVYIGTAFQMCSFAVFIPASASLVNKLMAKTDAVRGQAMIPVMTCTSSLISSFFGGFILDRAGVRPLLAIVTVSAAIGTFITIIAVRAMRLEQKNVTA